MFDILLKFSMLNNFGGAYTLKNIDDESYQELMYIQVCLAASESTQNTKGGQTFTSKEFL